MLAGASFGVLIYGALGLRAISRGNVTPRVIHVVVRLHLLRSLINVCVIALTFTLTRDPMTVAGMAAGLLLARNAVVIHYIVREGRTGTYGSSRDGKRREGS